MIFSKFTKVCSHRHNPILGHFHSPGKTPPATRLFLLQTQKAPLFFVCMNPCLWTHTNRITQYKYIAFLSGFCCRCCCRLYRDFVPFFPKIVFSWTDLSYCLSTRWRRWCCFHAWLSLLMLLGTFSCRSWQRWATESCFYLGNPHVENYLCTVN